MRQGGVLRHVFRIGWRIAIVHLRLGNAFGGNRQQLAGVVEGETHRAWIARVTAIIVRRHIPRFLRGDIFVTLCFVFDIGDACADHDDDRQPKQRSHMRMLCEFRTTATQHDRRAGASMRRGVRSRFYKNVTRAISPVERRVDFVVENVSFDTREQARRELFDYIEVFYKRCKKPVSVRNAFTIRFGCLAIACATIRRTSLRASRVFQRSTSFASRMRCPVGSVQLAREVDMAAASRCALIEEGCATGRDARRIRRPVAHCRSPRGLDGGDGAPAVTKIERHAFCDSWP